MNHYYRKGEFLQATLIPLGRFVTHGERIAISVGFGRTEKEADAALLESIKSRCVVDLAQINGRTE